MTIEEARAQYYEGRNLNAGIIYVKALEAEVERLRDMYQIHYKARMKAEAEVEGLKEQG